MVDKIITAISPVEMTEKINEIIDALGNAGGGSFLFQYVWSEYILNDIRFLRTDTFSWQNGGVYKAVYNHLFNDIGYIRYMVPDDGFDNKFYRSPEEDTDMFAWTNSYSTLYTVSEYPQNGDDFYYHDQVFGTILSTGIDFKPDAPTAETETIGGYTITYYTAPDGHKIVLPDQEETVLSIYNSVGIAWYYILDAANKRFKLPRTKYNFVGLRDTVGKYVPESLPNITGSFASGDTAYFTGAFSDGGSHSGNTQSGGSNDQVVNFSASRSSSTYQNNAPVQQRAIQAYLYCYVGNFEHSAIEQTAGLNTELFNEKVDIDLGNLTTTGKSYLSGIGMPSNTYEDLTLGASGSTYTAPANGYYYLEKVAGNNNCYLGLYNETRGYGVSSDLYAGTSTFREFLPVSKDDVVTVFYSATGSTTVFKFIYAKGEVNE